MQRVENAEIRRETAVFPTFMLDAALGMHARDVEFQRLLYFYEPFSPYCGRIISPAHYNGAMRYCFSFAGLIA